MDPIYSNSELCLGQTYSISEAASLCNSHVEALYDAASDSTIRILFKPPTNACIVELDINTLRLEREIHSSDHVVRLELYKRLIGNGPLIVSNHIDFLIVSPQDCLSLLRQPSIDVSLFLEGLAFRGGKQIFVTPKNRLASTSSGILKQVPRGRLFAIYDSKIIGPNLGERFAKAPSSVHVNPDRLFITHDDLCLYQRRKRKRALQKSFNEHLATTEKNDARPSKHIEKAGIMTEQRRVTEFIPKNTYSKDLVKLVETYRYFWLRIYSRFEAYPKSSTDCNVVMEHIVKECRFPRTIALLAAAMLRPEYARGTPDVELQRECCDYFPERLWCLLVAAEKFQRIEPTERFDSYEREKKIFDWLHRSMKFPSNAAKAGARIILGTVRPARR